MGAVSWLALSCALALISARPRLGASGRTGSTPLALDLGAGLLRAGQPVASALRLIAPAAAAGDRAALNGVGRMLELGAHPDDAWRSAQQSPDLQNLASAARRSAESGARVADAFERAASQLRRDARTTAEMRAQRVGVWAIAPLGLCFLPAFVCLGIVPVVAGLVTGVLS
jgi:Flp pilus assembly protein TadB